MFNTFDDFMKYNEFVKKEKEKAEGKGKWGFVFIYSMLGVTFPIILGASVFTYKMAQHYAGLFN